MRSCLAALLVLTATLLHAQTPRVLVRPGPAPNTRGIWVLQADNTLLRYDAAQFRPWGGTRLPPEARKHPEGIAISADGLIMYAFPAEESRTLRRLWLSDPRIGEVVGGADEKRPAAGGGYVITSATPDVYFSSAGDRLFWFENREQRLNRDSDVSREARFLAWTTDLDGRNPHAVTEFAFPPCKCETGACQESCPEALAWAPYGGMSDFFFVTRWVPGQIGSQYLETSLYRLTASGWTPRKLPAPVERFLDAADLGESYIMAVPDGGCCGWANEGDDTTTVVRSGKSTVIFDERQRLRNDNYDVSFFTDNALFSPDLARVAYTLVNSSLPEGKIPLSLDGKENPEELRRVRQSIAGMPRAEVVSLSDTSKVMASIANAELVGWLDADRLLVFKAGELQVLHAVTGSLTATGIKADGRQFVFLR